MICRSLLWITVNLDDKYVIICIKAKEKVDKHIYVVAIFSLKVRAMLLKQHQFVSSWVKVQNLQNPELLKLKF